MAEICNLLCAKGKLERDKGVVELQGFLKDNAESEILNIQHSLIDLLLRDESEWEVKHGALMGTKVLILESPLSCESFAESVRNRALVLLEDSESRVRLAAGELVGALCQKSGPSVYESCREHILNGISSNLERKDEEPAAEHANVDTLSQKFQADKPQLKRRLSKEDIFHDTAGWKSLETWMKCLQYAIDGCKSLFNPYVDQPLLDLIFLTLTHTNRFVRETGFYVCGALVGCNYSADGELLVPLEKNMVYCHGDQFASHLGRGLADNWSQVRMAASTAARSFLLGLSSEEARQKFYGTLLPPLCLNRYYVAEGVRIYNQETWRQVTRENGKQLVEMYIENVVAFYVNQSESDNHAVREAACACIAELGHKMDKAVLSPFIPTLLNTLIVCFQDDSWPVRDASCVACGNFISCFPEESKGSIETLFPLFYQNLEDNIPSVRQGAAVALGNVMKAYGQEILETLVQKIKTGLEGVAEQKADTERYGSLDKSPATYGVVKQLRDNDMQLHENNPMYSCGSLAPKMGRGKREGGCMDHQFRRPPEPWELADGCVYLTSELAQRPLANAEVLKLLPLLVKAASHRHYTQHVVFLETLCKQISYIAKGVGKRSFKMYLEEFFEPIFYSLNCDNALTKVAAQQCLEEIGVLIGPSILRGRVENYDPRYLDLLPPPSMGPSGAVFPASASTGINPGVFPRPFGSSHDPFANIALPGNVNRISGQLQKPTAM